MSKEKMIPKLMIAAVGSATYVFLDGKCISDGVEDLKYSARSEKGELCPTLDMKINIKGFSFESGMSIEEFMKKNTELKEMFQQSDQKKKELLEPKEEV